MRSGASGRPRASCSSLSAWARLLWSEARRRRWRVNSSAGVAGDGLLQLALVAPLRHPDRRPARPALLRSATPRTARGRRARSARAPAWARRAAGRRRGPRARRRPARPGRGPRPCRATKPLRPTTRPLRTKNTCTAASRSSSAMPMTSRSSLRSATICCFSIALRTLASRSRSRAARSNSRSSAAAAHLAPRAADDRVGVAVEEVDEVVDQPVVVGSWSISPTHGPGALLDVEQQARPAEPLVAVELVVASRCGWGTCAAAGRASRGWRRRGRRARSSGRPCACGPA